MTTLEEFQGLRVYRVLKRIGEQPTREKERDILKRIAERNQIQIRIAVLAQGITGRKRAGLKTCT